MWKLSFKPPSFNLVLKILKQDTENVMFEIELTVGG